MSSTFNLKYENTNALTGLDFWPGTGAPNHASCRRLCLLLFKEKTLRKQSQNQRIILMIGITVCCMECYQTGGINFLTGN